MAEGQSHIGAAPRRFVGKDFADDPQDVRAALARRDVAFHALGEEKESDVVVVAGGGKADQRGQLGGQLAFAGTMRADVLRGGGVDHEEQRHLALLHEFLDVGDTGAGGDIPVDAADVVAGGVGPDLVEVHAPPLEDRVVLAGEDILHQPRRAQLDSADVLEPLAGDHRRGASSRALTLSLTPDLNLKPPSPDRLGLRERVGLRAGRSASFIRSPFTAPSPGRGRV